jgi:hypothetical protein
MTAHERGWQVMRRREEFTLADLVREGTMQQDNARRLVRRLVREGVVEEVGWTEASNPAKVFRLAAQTGCAWAEVRPMSVLQRLWLAMRVKRTFTAPDLMGITGAGAPYVWKILKRLCRAGIVRLEGRLQPAGQPGSHQVYRLIRDEGPLPPAAMSAATRRESRSDESRAGEVGHD